MKRFLGGVAALIAATLVVSVPGAQSVAATLTYPTPFTYFPVCATTDQEFCIEKFEFTPTSGAKQDLTSGAGTVDNSRIYLETFISQSYSGPSGSAGPGGLFPALSVNYQYIPGTSWNTPTRPPTVDGVPDGTYRSVVRIGDYDPSFLFLTGKYDAYSVTKGADGYFTVDVTSRPTATASAVELNGSRAALDACEAGNWVTNCESNMATRRTNFFSMMMSADATQRDLLRGTWVSTNASVFSLGKIDLVAGVFDVTAKGPHYVPTDFGIPGLTQENGRELAPAFFEMSLTFQAISKMLSQVAGKEVSVDQTKQVLADPSKIFEGTIDEAAAGQVTEKLQQLTMTLGDNGLRVNFNLTHFSAPNPTLKVRSSSAQQTLSVLLTSSTAGGATTGGTTTGGGTSTAAPANYVRTAASGAKATLTINLLAAQKVKIYRKVGSKLTLLKQLTAKKGTNKYVTVYKKTYTFVVKDAKGKTIPPLLSSSAFRFGLRYLV
jgi:hypothetical protein